MAELLDQFEEEIERISLIPSDEGRFELKVNGTLLYSKLKTSRHMEPDEATSIMRKLLKEGS